MYVSQERGPTKKSFQKPNILKRKTKGARLNTHKNNESPDVLGLISAADSGICLSPSSGHVEREGRCSPPVQIVQPSQFSVVGIHEINQSETSQTLETNGDSMTIYAHNAQEDNNAPCITDSTLNIESFLNDGVINQNDLLNKETYTFIKMETDSEQGWCLDFVNEHSKATVTTDYYDGSQTSGIYNDKSSSRSREDEAVASLLTYETNTSQEIESRPAQNLFLDSVSTTSGPVKLKCDVPNCDKSFWTEARLQKHKNTHKNQKEKTPTILTCPVKIKGADGVETKCDKTFLIRRLLMSHLNKDHTPEDALYRCTACGRRFFWAGGASAHQAGVCARAFVCAWAGCGRVFRHPCRLREHARAHTGDRPYPCEYPNCGWAFRSASKLVRHARRHTGERRHQCSACGRAFLRREHLRDHVARHHAQHDRPQHVCTEDGCEQTFKSSSSLVMHVKKVHMKNEGKPSAPKKAQKNSRTKKDMFVGECAAAQHRICSKPGSTYSIPTVSLVDTQSPIPEASDVSTTGIEPSEHGKAETVQSTCMDDDVDMDSDVTELESRCARTHCTWPLQRQHSEYSIEEDDQVQQSESSESNTYTVRSDLFLHGNVLINEDSEFIRIGSVPEAGVAEGGEGEGEGQGDGEAAGGGALELIDAHPTIDLMQEELMYADAVDESSFRVFLLNGEELA